MANIADNRRWYVNKLASQANMTDRQLVEDARQSIKRQVNKLPADERALFNELTDRETQIA